MGYPKVQNKPAAGTCMQEHFPNLKNIFLCLAVLGLTFGMWDLQLQYVGSSSLTRDQPWAPCTESAES